MEIVEGTVYSIRQSRTQPGFETVHVMVDSSDGNDDRVFGFWIEPGTYASGDKVTLEIKGVTAKLIPAPAT